jgi:methanogenic corrinoid protein MtbC1
LLKFNYQIRLSNLINLGGTMDTKYEAFMSAFNQLDKDKSVQLVYDWLNKEELTVIELYENILVRALSNLSDIESDPTHKIWFEHIQSSIVRTIIEMSHPFVLASKKPFNGKRAAVICPDGEQHELGARMINDYLILAGIQSFFVGRDTPKSEFIGMINELKLDYVAISVTNYYNLSEVHKTIQLIEDKADNVTIVLGGRAIINNPAPFLDKKHMVILSDSDSLFRWLEEVSDETSI